MSTRLAAAALVVAASVGFLGAQQSEGIGRPLTLRSQAATTPLLGLNFARLGTSLVRVDRSLKILPGRKLALDRFGWFGWSFSPDRRRLVFGNQTSAHFDTPAAFRLVDVQSLRPLGDLDLGVDGFVPVSYWVEPDRLLAVVQSSARASFSLMLVDPVAKRVLERRVLEGTLAAAARAQGALVLLVEPATFGPVRVVVADTSGGVRTVTLERIHAGVSTTPPPRSFSQADSAGLDVDAGSGQAYVVAAGDPVAEVDLASLAVAYHTPAQPASLLGRLHDWLEPKARAKEFLQRSSRHALWLGGGRLAMFGQNGAPYWQEGRLQVRLSPSGLTVIDTGSWTARVVDPRSSSLVVGDGTLLSWGWTWDSGRQKQTGTGLTVYGPSGVKRFHVFGTRALVDVQVVGPRAFVRKLGPASGYSIVSLGSGRVVRTIRGREMPLVLSGLGSNFYG